MTQNPESPGGLPVFALDLDPARLDFSGNGEFWPRVQTLVAEGGLGAHLDGGLAGRSAPRVWAVLFDAGQAGLALTAAFSLTAALCERDQSVLVLDGDDHQSLLTRLAGLHQAHGWIDMARYGASILTCGQELPFAGRRGHLLGVGSFAPTDVTAAEVGDLLTRLRRQADDIIILAPLDPTGRLWNAAADIRLVCWDRTRTDAARMEQLVAGLQAEGPLVGLVATGEVAPVAGVVTPDAEPPAEDPVEPAEPVAAEGPAPDVTEPDVPEPVADEPADPVEADEPAEQVEPDDAADPDREPAATGLNLAALLAAEEADAESGLEPELDSPENQRTSRVFWGAAIISVVIILAASVYWAKFLRVQENGHFERLSPGSSLSDVGAGTRTEDPVIVTPPPVLAVADSAVADSVIVAPADTLIAAEADLPPEEPAVDVAAETPDPPDPAPADQEPVFSMAPYQGPVGADGWAIHVYSLPDSAAADKEIGRLERRGFTTGLRIVEVPDKGRWYRLYLGSFSSRADARAAMPPLLEKLGETWAQVRPYTPDTR